MIVLQYLYEGLLIPHIPFHSLLKISYSFLKWRTLERRLWRMVRKVLLTIGKIRLIIGRIVMKIGLMIGRIVIMIGMLEVI